jgi:hypothetical protein
MSTITWQFQATIPGGPALTINQPSIEIQSYDVATATIAGGATGVAVSLQPSITPDDVVLVVVNSDVFDAGLTYVVDGGTNVHALDAPHVLLGSGAVGFMSASTPPQTLTFDNTLTQAAHVQIVVGRK